MDPDQRVHRRSLIMIRHHQLGTPRPLSRMPPLQEPPVSAPIRRREPLPHRSGSGAALRGTGGGDTARREAAQLLREEGLPIRDVGELIGVSHQRVSQILAS